MKQTAKADFKAAKSTIQKQNLGKGSDIMYLLYLILKVYAYIENKWNIITKSKMK